MKKICILLLVLITFILTGCATLQVNTTFIDKDYHPENIRNANLIVACSDDVKLEEFVKSYNTLYSNNQNFSKILTDSLAQRIHNKFPNSNVSTIDMDSLTYDFYNQIEFDNKLYQDKIIQNQNNYLILLKKTTIGQETHYNPGFINPTTGMHSAGTTTTKCTLKFEVEVIDLVQKGKVHSFTVFDSVDVFFFAYKTALSETISKTLRGLVNSLDVYIENTKSNKF